MLSERTLLVKMHNTSLLMILARFKSFFMPSSGWHETHCTIPVRVFGAGRWCLIQINSPWPWPWPWPCPYCPCPWPWLWPWISLSVAMVWSNIVCVIPASCSLWFLHASCYWVPALADCNNKLANFGKRQDVSQSRSVSLPKGQNMLT